MTTARPTSIHALAALLLASLAASAAETKINQPLSYAVPPRLDRVGTATFDLGGRQEVFHKAIIQGWLLGAQERNPYMLGMFEEANKPKNGNLLPWSGEFAGKHLTGGVFLYRLTRHRGLKQSLDELAKRLCGLQTPTGYLGPWPREFELTCKMPGGGATWDAWNHYQIMIGLLEYHRLTGDELSLETCRRIGDRLCAEFLDHPDKLVVTEKTGWYHGNMEFNLTPAHSLCLLYRATGDRKYLDLVRQMVGEGFARHGDYLKRALAGKEFHQTESKDGNRWERLHTLMALPELYWLTGEEDYRKAFEHLWWSIAKTDIHNHGAFSTGEAASGNPYADGPVETCCTIAWQAMSVEMLKMTANPVVADMLELAQLNAAYGSWDLSGEWSTYHTGMSGQRRPSTVEIDFQVRKGSEQLNCCSVNAPRGVGILADWAVMRQEQGLALNWFGPGSITTEAGGVSIKLTQTTDYPRTGEVLIQVDPQRAAPFALDVRIPFWSQNTKVEVNGQAVADVRPATYLRLQREWRPGDTIKLLLDMRPHFWPGERQYASRGSIYRGPVLLAWRSPDGQVAVKERTRKWRGYAHLSHDSETPGDRLVAEFTGERLWLDYDQSWNGGRSRLSIDGREAVVLDHYAPAGFTLREWQSPPLSPGKHQVMIEVLKDADPASKGHWVHLREFRVKPLPVLDSKTLTLSVPTENVAGVPWLRFTATDAQGRRIELEDFDSAGKNDGTYHTWLPLEGLDPATFTRTNPLRSIRP